MPNEIPPEVSDAIGRHAALFDTPWQAVIGTTLGGEIAYWNEAAERIYGWTREEVLGRNIVAVTPTDLSRAQAEAIMARLRAGRTWSGEFLVQGRDGREFRAIVKDVPVADESGQAIGVVGISNPVRTGDGE
jgi:PAS domain S-box-containing protein